MTDEQKLMAARAEAARIKSRIWEAQRKKLEQCSAIDSAGSEQPRFYLESAGPMLGNEFFDNSSSGFPSAAQMLDSRLWFEEGASGELELRFACRPQPFQSLVFCMAGGYLVFDRIDFVRSRAVFSASGWHPALPSGLAEPVGWLDASGPLPGAPLSADESGSSHA